ncbi:MAG: hypothetical protein ACHQAY_01265 [Hyphomicrobiales bacterium]
MRRFRLDLSFRRFAEKVEPALVDAAQIAPAQRDAVTIQELENLDRDLASILQPVAELGGAELALWR